MSLTIGRNRYYVSEQHQLIGLYTGAGLCSLWGRNRIVVVIHMDQYSKGLNSVLGNLCN
jgi:hypothetical protein